MPGRTFSSSSYRYGFNGKEIDSTTYGQGNEYDYGFRIYNSRIGRFLSVDPLTRKYPTLTPYQFASNKPTAGVDIDGLEFLPINSSIYRQKYLGSVTILGLKGEQYELQTVYENIPNALKDPQTKDLKFTYGGPVTTSGRDWDVSKDGDYVATPGRYNNSGPEFWGLADEAEPDVSKSSMGLYNFDTKKSAIDKNEANESRLASIAEVVEQIKGIGSNWSNHSTKVAMNTEAEARNGFYNATNIVDKYRNKNLIGDKTLTNGQGRVSLINFLTDGTLPTGNLPIAKLSQSEIENDLRVIFSGYQLILREGVELRDELSKTFSDLNNAYKKGGGKLNFDKVFEFRRPVKK